MRKRSDMSTAVAKKAESATEVERYDWDEIGATLNAFGAAVLPKLMTASECARIAALRTALYAQIAPFANAWNERMNIAVRYPQRHTDYLKLCHEAGQTRPTPLLLQYGPGDFNCLH